jgi:hypothetical protein
MAAAECQSRQPAEVIATLDGAFAADPTGPCREDPAYEVHVEHVIGLRVVLCKGCASLVELTPGYRRMVHLRSGYWREARST